MRIELRGLQLAHNVLGELHLAQVHDAVTGIGELILFGLSRLTERADYLLTLKLAAIMLPYVLLICGTAFLGGVLQVHRRFGPPAIAPVILNIVHILVVFFGAAMLGLSGRPDESRDLPLQTTLAYWLAGFVLVAGVLQVMVLMPALRLVESSAPTKREPISPRAAATSVARRPQASAASSAR